MKKEFKVKKAKFKWWDKEKEFKWIKITEIEKSKTGKTKVFEVVNRIYDDSLGIIKWQPSYRKYAYYPESSTFYEEGCLKDIADFLEDLK